MSLPAELTYEHRQDLLTAAMSGPEGRRAAAMEALSLYSIDTPTESILVRVATSASERLRRRALVALSKKAGRLALAEPVYWIVIHSSAEMETKAAALYCLEKTMSFDTDLLSRDSERMPPLLRYHAARCLIKVNSRRGVDLLLGILEMAASESSRTDPRLLGASRRLLAHISGKGIGTSSQEWARSIQEIADISLSTLPEPPFLNP